MSIGSAIVLLLAGCYAAHEPAEAVEDAAVQPASAYERPPPVALPELHTPCAPDADAIVVDVPYGAAPIEIEIEMSTTLQAADVFFLTDATGSMSGTLSRVQRTVAGRGGLIEELGRVIPDAWVGGGSFRDFPFGEYGHIDDSPFTLAIGMTPPEQALDVRDAFLALEAMDGGDGAESSTEALYQAISGTGGRWTAPIRYAPEFSIAEQRCGDHRFGAACFREGARPILVHFTDTCSHNGGTPAGVWGCEDYQAITPAPASYDEMIAALRARGAGVSPQMERAYGVCIDARTGGTAVTDTRSLLLRVPPV